MDEQWRWGRRDCFSSGTEDFIFLYFTSGSHQPKAGMVLTLSLFEEKKGKGLQKKKKKKIIWMVNRRGTCAALAPCHCLHCKRCQSHHIRLLPGMQMGSEAGSAGKQLPPAHFRLLAGTLQWTKTE